MSLKVYDIICFQNIFKLFSFCCYICRLYLNLIIERLHPVLCNLSIKVVFDTLLVEK